MLKRLLDTNLKVNMHSILSHLQKFELKIYLSKTFILLDCITVCLLMNARLGIFFSLHNDSKFITIT